MRLFIRWLSRTYLIFLCWWHYLGSTKSHQRLMTQPQQRRHQTVWTFKLLFCQKFCLRFSFWKISVVMWYLSEKLHAIVYNLEGTAIFLNLFLYISDRENRWISNSSRMWGVEPEKHLKWDNLHSNKNFGNISWNCEDMNIQLRLEKIVGLIVDRSVLYCLLWWEYRKLPSILDWLENLQTRIIHHDIGRMCPLQLF